MADMTRFTVNGRPVETNVEEDTPLLWVLRDELGLKGTKFACGAALCGACTVHVDGEVVRSCSRLVSDFDGAAVTTIEGLATDDGGLHSVQQAWVEEAVPQCGYCQSGVIMAAARLIEAHPDPTDAQIDRAMNNLCRCGTYERIRRGVRRAAELARG